MAKVDILYKGIDSVGNNVEVAFSDEGYWFSRVYCRQYNNFGYAWSKWKLLDENAIVHPDRILNHSEYYDAPEYIEIPESERMNHISWGWKTLHRTRGGEKYRLPNMI